MALIQLSVKNVRNLVEQTLEPSTHVNLIHGDNGSGKSSLLESIYLLGRGKSFRTHLLKQAITTDYPELMVVGKFLLDNGQGRTIGFSYDRQGKAVVRVDQHTLSASSTLASYFPLLFIGSHTGRLLSLGEKQRRRCMDWGVFHVEPLFLNEWRRYSRALKQRNAALQRGHAPEVIAWDKELVGAGEAITLFRQVYLEALKPIFFHFVNVMSGGTLQVTRFAFEQGWTKSTQSLLDYFSENLTKDLAVGYTQRGPHRSDFKIDIQHGSLNQYGSGGQQKLVTCALLLSQVALFKERTGHRCTILVDDLPAELDREFRRNFINLLKSLNMQIFISSTEQDLVSNLEEIEKKMFHVKQGKLEILA